MNLYGDKRTCSRYGAPTARCGRPALYGPIISAHKGLDLVERLTNILNQTPVSR
jgi:hypothetical protein